MVLDVLFVRQLYPISGHLSERTVPVLFSSFPVEADQVNLPYFNCDKCLGSNDQRRIQSALADEGGQGGCLIS
jgi:hypothetical protein